MYNRYERKNYKPLRAISVARTVETPQQEFENFLQNAGRALGHRGNIRNIASTRITLLQSSGVQKVMRYHRRTDPQSATRFSYWMSNQLDSSRMEPITVAVNPKRPIKIMGTKGDKLTLNIIEDERLAAERNRTENLLQDEFGDLPEIRSFEPHITIGYIGQQALSALEIRRPESLIPNTAIPESIALNGLMVFVDGNGLKH